MGRHQRLNLPGYAFHIVTRAQGCADLFTRSRRKHIVAYIEQGVASAGARLISYVVMPNHLHIIMFQGAASLGWTMQPILRRIALLVHRGKTRKGHVFERRYRSHLLDARHLSNAILYVHRNPVKAGLCDDAADYPWSSHPSYVGLVTREYLCVEDGLQVFGDGTEATIEELRLAYIKRFTNMHYDIAGQITAGESRMMPRSTAVTLTDAASAAAPPKYLIDIRDAANVLIEKTLPGVCRELVRSRYGSPAIARGRIEVVAALVQRGYSGVDIGRYMRISPSRVSAIRSAMRWAPYEGMGQRNV